VPQYFLDTSAFAKLYHQEAGSDQMERIVEQRGSTSIVSRLALVEIESVFAIKVRTGDLSADGQDLCRRRLRSDLSQHRIRVSPPIEERHYWSARQLLIQHGVQMALRTLDALQLAVTLDLKQSGLVTAMVTADHKLCRVAGACGCPAMNPAEPGLVIP
jgi:predicted nucleic acid-binding protein